MPLLRGLPGDSEVANLQDRQEQTDAVTPATGPSPHPRRWERPDWRQRPVVAVEVAKT